MRQRTRWGGLGRPIDVLRSVAVAAVVAATWPAVAAPTAFGHGGVATLQVAVGRVNPGGTLDLLGDMTTEGHVDIQLVAPAEASVWLLGAVEADDEGHFRSFLIVPPDVPVGEYRVRAQMATEQATTSIVIAGLPIAGDEGQPLGQDEALAGSAASAAQSTVPAVVGSAPAPEVPATELGTNVPGILLAVAVALALALVLGTVLRSRGTTAGTSRR